MTGAQVEIGRSRSSIYTWLVATRMSIGARPSATWNNSFGLDVIEPRLEGGIGKKYRSATWSEPQVGEYPYMAGDFADGDINRTS